MLRVRRRILKQHKQEATACGPINKKKLCVELLTYDLIVEILSWLPPKFAVRCKMVCKLWRSIIQSLHFIEKHFQQQKAIMMYSRPSIIYRSVLPLPPDEKRFDVLYYLRGLVLEQNTLNNENYRIRNFTTNQVFQLPDLKERRIYSSMCHLPTNDEYKVLNLHWKDNSSSMGLKVLTIGTDVTWRSVEIPLLFSFPKNDDEMVKGRTLSNVCYITRFSWSSKFITMLAFQFEDESFVEISLPWSVKFCASGSLFRTMSWDNSYVCIRCSVGVEVRIWVLQDYRTSKWDETKIVFPSDLIKHNPFVLKLIPSSVHDSELLVLCPPNYNYLRPPNYNEMKQVNYNIKTKLAFVVRMGDMLKPSLVSL